MSIAETTATTELSPVWEAWKYYVPPPPPDYSGVLQVIPIAGAGGTTMWTWDEPAAAPARAD